MGTLYCCNLLDDKLWGFNAAIFVNVEPECKLDCSSIRRPGLIECDRIDDVAATSGPYSQFEMFLADDALLNN